MTKEQTEKAALVAQTALTVAASFVPGLAGAVTLAPIALKGVFAIYDAVMAARPAEVTEAEWRELLSAPALTKSADDYLREAQESKA